MTKRSKKIQKDPKVATSLPVETGGTLEIPPEIGRIVLAPGGDGRQSMTLSDHLSAIGRSQIAIKDREQPVTPEEYLAEMLWSFVITGRAKYSDGVEVRIPNHDQWMKVVRWVTERMYGSTLNEIVQRTHETRTVIDLSGCSIEELAQLQALAMRIQGGE